MKLIQAHLQGYRSISQALVLHLDGQVTVLLGANDHGKTNILEALTHLNKDVTFDPENDLNWDHIGEPDKFPFLKFQFALDDQDRADLLMVAQARASAVTAAAIAAAAVTTSVAPPATPPDPADPAPPVDPEPAVLTERLLTLDDVPDSVNCTKTGVTGEITFLRAPRLPDGSVTAFATPKLPRIELIKAQDAVPDSVSASELMSEQHEFMRGIFYYAGLDREEFESLFVQTDATMMRLERAQKELNKTLRANWTQGSDLEFRLVHESKTDRIVLRIKDPAVGGRLVRASQRSSGFTHFFSLKTRLYSRQREHPANSYIFLFDEPGIYLHPSGQYDLLQVLDTIGRANQILYSTHSLFMLNKTFPMRHRLIVKTAAGTTLDGKPYVGRWGSALEALGLSLAGTILFAQHILLAEGDSDPMYIPAILQKLIALKHASVDLNSFSVIATETSKNTDALIRLLSEASTAPKMAILVDGDDGGKARLKALQGIMKIHNIPSKALADGTTIEDYLPLVGELYVKAVVDYTSKVMTSAGQPPPDLERFRGEFRTSFRETFEEGKVTKNVAGWAANAAKKFGKLEQPPSKIGIAREYIALLEDAPVDHFTPQSLQRPLKLVEWIQEMLQVPPIRSAEADILRSE